MLATSDYNSILKTTVFYDGSCPLCGREIVHYRRLRGAENILWVDVSSDDTTLLAYGLDRHEAMQRFHVMDSMGTWHTGAYGFAELWSQLSAYRWLAWMLRKLRLLPLLDMLYSRFAQWRINRNCSVQQCGNSQGGRE